MGLVWCWVDLHIPLDPKPYTSLGNKFGLGKYLTRKVRGMLDNEDIQDMKNDPIVREIIELEREYFFGKRNVNTERRRKLREIIERHTKPGDQPR